MKENDIISQKHLNDFMTGIKYGYTPTLTEVYPESLDESFDSEELQESLNDILVHSQSQVNR